MAEKKERFAKVISVYNRKGGVGKSYLSVNIAGYLSKNPKNRVLYLDFDSQCDTSICYLGIDKELLSSEPTTYKSILNIPGIRVERMGVDIPKLAWNEIIVKAPRYNLFTIYPSVSMDYYWDNSDEAIDSLAVRDFIDTVRDKFDYVVINLGPSTSSMTLSSLFASDYILLTTNPDVSSLNGIEDFFVGFWPNIKEYNPYCECLGLVVNRFDSRSHMGFFNNEATKMAEKYGFFLFDTKIPNCAGVGNVLSEKFMEDNGVTEPMLFFNPKFKNKYKTTAETMKMLIMEIILKIETDQF